VPFGVIDFPVHTDKGLQMGDQQTPKIYGFQNLFSLAYTTQENSLIERYHYFRNPIKMGRYRVGGLQNLDPLKCRNFRINAARRIAICKSAMMMTFCSEANYSSRTRRWPPPAGLFFYLIA